MLPFKHELVTRFYKKITKQRGLFHRVTWMMKHPGRQFITGNFHPLSSYWFACAYEREEKSAVKNYFSGDDDNIVGDGHGGSYVRVHQY
jgi:hypothetical protein